MVNSGNDAWIWQNYFRVTSNWLKDHFNLEANKTRLLRIDIPVYIFHGVDDGNVPIEGVYDIQSRFRQANKTNLQCFIFEGHNHDLNYLDWPFEHKISEGLNSIFNASQLLFLAGNCYLRYLITDLLFRFYYFYPFFKHRIPFVVKIIFCVKYSIIRRNTKTLILHHISRHCYF